jgi:hypothetical protein
MSKLCKLCSKRPAKLGKVCPKCALRVSIDMNETITKIKQTIEASYGLTKVEHPPYLVCGCKVKESFIVPFDYYTVNDSLSESGMYDLVICGVCRYCGNYSEVRMPMSFDIPIKDSPYKGLMLEMKQEPQKRNEMII